MEQFKKKNKCISNFKRSLPFLLLALPGALVLFLFRLVPLFGLVLPFKNVNNVRIKFWEADWAGFKNFEFLFKSDEILRVTRNTLFYNIIGILAGIVVGVGVALLLFELANKYVKIYQTVLYLPYFISFVVVAFIMKGLLDMEYGIFNKIVVYFGGEKIFWYNDPKYWFWIIPLASIWKNLGNNVLMYYAALIGISPELYESARIDGAGKLKQVWYISIPMIKNIIVVLFILNVGKIMYADFGLFYNVPLNLEQLYEATDVLDTYVYRTLMFSPNIGMSAAAAFYQAVVGFILVIVSNSVAKKIDPESGMF